MVDLLSSVYMASLAPADRISSGLSGRKLDKDMFVFFEGSDVLAKLVPGDLDAFKKLVDDEKVRYRTDNYPACSTRMPCGEKDRASRRPSHVSITFD
jgi:hypothetical protein